MVPHALLVAISRPTPAEASWGRCTRRHHRQGGDTLRWHASSRAMNPTIGQRVVDEALIAE